MIDLKGVVRFAYLIDCEHLDRLGGRNVRSAKDEGYELSQSCRWLTSYDRRSGRGQLLQALTSDSTPRIDSACYRRHRLQKFGWALKSLPGVFLQQDLQKNNDRLRHALQLSNRQRCLQVLVHQFGGCASEWRLPRQHLPERRAERIQVRADVYLYSRKLLGTGKLWCPSKRSWQRNRGLRRRLGNGFR